MLRRTVCPRLLDIDIPRIPGEIRESQMSTVVHTKGLLSRRDVLDETSRTDTAQFPSVPPSVLRPIVVLNGTRVSPEATALPKEKGA